MPGSGWCCSLRKENRVNLAAFLYFAAEHMILVTALPYVTYGVCRDVFPNVMSQFCLHINRHPVEARLLQKDSALLLMAEKMFSTLPPLVLAAFLGPWSDVHGRRLPLLLPYAGNALAVGLFLVAIHLQTQPVTLVLMAAFLSRSLSGSFIMVHIMSFSCIADIVKHDADRGPGVGEAGTPPRGEGRRAEARARTPQPALPRYSPFAKSLASGRDRGTWGREGGRVGRVEGRGGQDREGTGRAGREADSVGREGGWTGEGGRVAEAVNRGGREGRREVDEGRAGPAEDAGRSQPWARARHGDDTRDAPLTERDAWRASVSQSQLTVCMSRLQVAESMGTVVGALLSWALQKAGGPSLSFSVAGAVLGLGMAVVVATMQEWHRPPGPGCPPSDGPSALRSCLQNVASTFNWKRVEVDRKVLLGCLLVTFLSLGCQEGRAAIMPVYVQQEPLSWPNETLAAFVSVRGAFLSLFLFLLAPRVRDRTLVAVGLLGGTAGGLWLAFSFTTWSMMGAGCLSHLLGCVFPALRAILTHKLRQDQVGRALASLSAAEALSTIAGPAVLVTVYNRTLDFFPGVAFLASSLAPAAVLLVWACVEALTDDPELVGEEEEGGGEGSRPCQSSEVAQARDASQRPDFTRSLNVPSATVSGYGLFWGSAEW